MSSSIKLVRKLGCFIYVFIATLFITNSFQTITYDVKSSSDLPPLRNPEILVGKDDVM